MTPSIRRALRDGGNFFSSKKRWLEKEPPEFKAKLYNIAAMYDNAKVLYRASLKLARQRKGLETSSNVLLQKRQELLSALNLAIEDLPKSEFSRYIEEIKQYQEETTFKAKTLWDKTRAFQLKMDSYRDVLRKYKRMNNKSAQSKNPTHANPDARANFVPPSTPPSSSTSSQAFPFNVPSSSSQYFSDTIPELVTFKKDLLSDYDSLVRYIREFMDYCTVFVIDSLNKLGIYGWAHKLVRETKEEDRKRNAEIYDPILGNPFSFYHENRDRRRAEINSKLKKELESKQGQSTQANREEGGRAVENDEDYIEEEFDEIKSDVHEGVPGGAAVEKEKSEDRLMDLFGGSWMPAEKTAGGKRKTEEKNMDGKKGKDFNRKSDSLGIFDDDFSDTEDDITVHKVGIEKKEDEKRNNSSDDLFALLLEGDARKLEDKNGKPGKDQSSSPSSNLDSYNHFDSLSE